MAYAVHADWDFVEGVLKREGTWRKVRDKSKRG